MNRETKSRSLCDASGRLATHVRSARSELDQLKSESADQRGFAREVHCLDGKLLELERQSSAMLLKLAGALAQRTALYARVKRRVRR